jgi:hyperosmotically inducible protein
MFRLVLLAALAAGAAWMLGYRWSDVAGRVRAARANSETGSWTEDIDRERIREAGSELASRIGDGAGRAEAVLDEARLTAKIKAKITLDDTLDGSRIDVDTEGAAVTLSGTVASPAQRDRALQLARETKGVTSVADRLLVQPR